MTSTEIIENLRELEPIKPLKYTNMEMIKELETIYKKLNKIEDKMLYEVEKDINIVQNLIGVKYGSK